MCDDIVHCTLVGWSVRHKLKFLIFRVNQVGSEIHGYLQNPWDIPVNLKPPKPNKTQTQPSRNPRHSQNPKNSDYQSNFHHF